MVIKKVIDVILSSIYIVYFFILLYVFHVIQYVCYTFGGQKVHQKSVEWLNFFIVKGWILTGSTSSIDIKHQLPENKTIIFISNHQSMFDIPGIVWYLRKYTPLFISKKELSKGIPSISYNLRASKAALIDRNDHKQSISEIIRFANYIRENNFSGVIFPEGTRSRTGKLKPFAIGGIATLLKKCPDAIVVPIAIQNSCKFLPKGFFPATSFTHISWTTLKPISTENKTYEEIAHEAEVQISDFIA